MLFTGNNELRLEHHQLDVTSDALARWPVCGALAPCLLG